MTRTACVFALLLCVCKLAVFAASPRWRWSNPLPHGNNVNDMAFRTNRGYVQVGDKGQLYTSANSLDWIRVDQGFREQLRAAVFFGNRFVASGEAGRIVWSDDLISFQTIKLDTSDWLEGIAASSVRMVAVGDNGALYTSENGSDWTPRSLPAEQQAWFRGVVWGGNLVGTFVVVGENGTILTSLNGLTWTKQAVTAANGAHLNRVAWTGSNFMVVGDGGTVIFGNTAGTSWVRQQASGATGDLNGAAASSSASRLIAGNLELRHAAVSPSLVIWSSQTSPSLTEPAPIANYLSALWDGVTYVVGGRAGLLVFGVPTSSPDEFNWVTYPSPTREWLFDLATTTAYGTNVTATFDGESATYHESRTTNEFYVAAGDRASIVNSDDGVSWHKSLVPAVATNQTFFGIGGNAQGMVAAGSSGTLAFSPVDFTELRSTNHFTNGATVTEIVVTNWVNTIGLAWNPATSSTTNDLQAVAASASRYVIGGAEGFLATSDDGTNWVQRTSGTTRFLSGLEAHASGFVAVGDAGTVLTSPDGADWTPQPSGTTNWLYRVRSANGLFVAVGQNGTIATSPDAATWTLQSTGVTNWLNDVEFVEGQWFVAGNQGTVLSSPDGVTWTADATLPTGKSLYAAATLRGQLVMAGIEGVILRAQIGPFPTPVAIANYPKKESDQLFLFVGKPDQRFRIDRTTSLTQWQPETELEITAANGARLYFSGATNDPSLQFFRTIELAP